jgi:hypothetical protein
MLTSYNAFTKYSTNTIRLFGQISLPSEGFQTPEMEHVQKTANHLSAIFCRMRKTKEEKETSRRNEGKIQRIHRKWKMLCAQVSDETYAIGGAQPIFLFVKTPETKCFNRSERLPIEMRLVERKSNRYKPSPSLPTTINCL